MNKKIIIGIVAAIIALSGIIWLGKIDSQNKNLPAIKSKGILAAEEMNFDFGEISMAKGNVEHSFKIKNTGPEAVIINKIYTSCMCTTALFIKNSEQFGPFGMHGYGIVPKINQAINPDEEAEVKVIFNPTAHGPAGVGQIKRTIFIENNSENNSEQPFELEIEATVTP